jgi:hypothetical protein
MVKLTRKTTAALLPCVAITIFITGGCADKKKIETTATVLDGRAAVTTTATDTESQTIDKDMALPCVSAKEKRLKCKRIANGLLECLDADDFRMLANGVPEKKRDTWYLFFAGDNDSCLRPAGFKDKNWVTRYDVRIDWIDLKFGAYRFDDLTIADGYYHTRTGKKFGKDSVLHVLDHEACIPNCENEGFMVFYDRKRDRQGVFNRNGDVAIPAEYNELTNVQNGMVVARKGAVRKKFGDAEDEDCGGDGDYEHCYWVGGTWLLIDTLNNVLIEDLGSIDSCGALNLFSVKKTEKPHPDTAIRKSFPAKSGGYYSFISYDKELMYWLTRDLLKNLTVEKLINATYDSISYESSYYESSPSFHSTGVSGNKRSFVTNNFKSLKKALMDILNPELEIDLYSAMYGGAFYYFIVGSEKYYDNCGRIKYWIYPIREISIRDKDYNRNVFTFLRTDNGYILIGVEIKNDDNFRPQAAD